MEFRISDSFSDSLSKLMPDEQKAVKTTAFDLQMNPANPGMKFHKIERAKDKRFWSVRVNNDIRIIVHKANTSLMLCYVDHHDDAYRWAENRKLETHPKTGAAQIVEIKERIKEVTIPIYVQKEEKAEPKPPVFAGISDDELLSYGVPTDWIGVVKEANEDTLLELADHLPGEAAEALLDLAVGTKPQPIPAGVTGTDPFEHPDAQRRFRVVNNIEELERALDYPWEKWTIFLHPAQRQLVEKDYNGPARISGTAGTGKTIVALHRAFFLARNNPDSRILLTTFSETLANSLRTKLKRLISNEPRIAERLEVHALDTIGKRLYELNYGKVKLASKEDIKQIIEEVAGKEKELKFSLNFLVSEWLNIVDAWQLKSWEDYRDVPRTGRKTRLTEKHRESIWGIFKLVQETLQEKDLITLSGLFNKLAFWLENTTRKPFDFTVVDEAQDISIPQLCFLAALGGGKENRLFFTGDLGQRIFQQPFSWKALGIDIRGRSKTLRINYRTSHQIRRQADRLLAKELTDLDGITEIRKNAISVFNGPEPSIQILGSKEEEVETVSGWILTKINEGVKPHELGVFVRSPAELGRAIKAVEEAGLTYKLLDEKVQTTSGHVSICTMHLAKGLEFRAVVVMACDDEVIPLQERIETVADESDLEEVYNTERHLLYVACTRARDYLLVTSTDPASEFLDDLTL